MRLLIFTLGLLVAVVRSQDNPQCPEPPSGLSGPCVFTEANCLEDSECSNGQICCPHLCGKICKDKVNLAISKPGTCPSNAAISCFIGSITDNCRDDIDCPGDQKCCDLCGKNCSPPEGSGPGLFPISPPVCPVVDCLPTQYCEFGYRLDSQGCQTCQCKKTPCKGEAPLTTDNTGNSIYCGLGGQRCPSNSQCVTHPADAYALCCPIEPVVLPPVCPVVDCFFPQNCEFGYRLDSNGCQTCQCKSSPCENEAPLTTDNNGNTINCGRGGVRCPSNSECKIHPADRYAVCCPKVCPPVCAVYCEYGNVMDENNCPTCTCKKTPCKGEAPLTTDNTGNSIYCGLGGQRCPSNSQCVTHPADAYALCCPIEPVAPPPVCPACLPSQYCEFGYRLDSQGCQTCQCKTSPCENEAPLTTDNNGNTINCGRGGVRCPSNSECKIHPTDRYAVCCPKGPIVLPPLPVVKSGSCPVPPSPFLVRCASINRCKYDSECEGTKKCCDHPCGRQCRDVVKSKPGVCPKPADPSLVLCKRRGDDCYEDSTCSGSQKCCQGACGNACMDTGLTPTDHAGTCPALDPKIQALIFCAYLAPECELDSDCNIDQKCCRDYCGIKCVKSVPKPTVKNGSCPRYRYRCLRQQRDFCSTDDDCRGSRKCCKLPCGKRCRNPKRSRPIITVPITKMECPVVKTNPFYKWFCALPLDPPCQVDRDCAQGEMCCPGSCYNRCLKAPNKPVCSANPCGDLQIKCQYGQAKDENGCLLCRCNQCPDGKNVVNCFADPCQVSTCNNPAGIRCVSNYCGGCNAVFYDASGNEVDCSVPMKGK